MKLQIIALAAGLIMVGHVGQAMAGPQSKGQKTRTAKTPKAPAAKAAPKQVKKPAATKSKPKPGSDAKNKNLSAKMQRRRQARRYPSIVGRVMNFFAERSQANRQRPYVKSMGLSSSTSGQTPATAPQNRTPRTRGRLRVRFASTGSVRSTTATSGDIFQVERTPNGRQ